MSCLTTPSCMCPAWVAAVLLNNDYPGCQDIATEGDHAGGGRDQCPCDEESRPLSTREFRASSESRSHVTAVPRPRHIASRRLATMSSTTAILGAGGLGLTVAFRIAQRGGGAHGGPPTRRSLPGARPGCDV